MFSLWNCSKINKCQTVINTQKRVMWWTWDWMGTLARLVSFWRSWELNYRTQPATWRTRWRAFQVAETASVKGLRQRRWQKKFFPEVCLCQLAAWWEDGPKEEVSWCLLQLVGCWLRRIERLDNVCRLRKRRK